MCTRSHALTSYTRRHTHMNSISSIAILKHIDETGVHLLIKKVGTMEDIFSCLLMTFKVQTSSTERFLLSDVWYDQGCPFASNKSFSRSITVYLFFNFLLLFPFTGSHFLRVELIINDQITHFSSSGPWITLEHVRFPVQGLRMHWKPFGCIICIYIMNHNSPKPYTLCCWIYTRRIVFWNMTMDWSQLKQAAVIGLAYHPEASGPCVWFYKEDEVHTSLCFVIACSSNQAPGVIQHKFIVHLLTGGLSWPLDFDLERS